MAANDSHKSSNRKRKQVDDETDVRIPQSLVQLEMLTDEEDVAEVSSDDGEADEFPEIDAHSDSEEEAEQDDEEYEGETEGEEDEEESEDDSDEPDSDASLRVFPEAKTVISRITGQPKRIYPEIEPEYDSDSSTEDVRTLPLPLA